jgi:hypothetical protein
VLLLTLPLYACAQAVTGSPFARPELTPATGGPLIITAFHPPAEYARWYANMERCMGMKGDYSKVRWLVVPAPWRGSDQVQGLTHAFWLKDRYGVRQVIVNAKEWQDSALVEHEVVHDILSYNHDQMTEFQISEQHPQPFFDGECAPEFYTPLAERVGERYTTATPEPGASFVAPPRELPEDQDEWGPLES